MKKTSIRSILAVFAICASCLPFAASAKTTTYGYFTYDNTNLHLLIKDAKTKRLIQLPDVRMGFNQQTSWNTLPDFFAAIKGHATIVSSKTLNRIPVVGKETSAGVAFAKAYAGKILKTSDRDTKVWFVDPTTKSRYYFEATLGSFLFLTNKLMPHLMPDEIAALKKQQAEADASAKRIPDAKALALHIDVPSLDAAVGDIATGTIRLTYSGLPAKAYVVVQRPDLFFLGQGIAAFATSTYVLQADTLLRATSTWEMYPPVVHISQSHSLNDPNPPATYDPFPKAGDYPITVSVFSCQEAAASAGSCQDTFGPDAEKVLSQETPLAQASVVIHVK